MNLQSRPHKKNLKSSRMLMRENLQRLKNLLKIIILLWRKSKKKSRKSFIDKIQDLKKVNIIIHV